jgi:hypothetical protein
VSAVVVTAKFMFATEARGKLIALEAVQLGMLRADVGCFGDGLFVRFCCRCSC